MRGLNRALTVGVFYTLLFCLVVIPTTAGGWPKRPAGVTPKPVKRQEPEFTRIRAGTPNWTVLVRRGRREIHNLNVEVINVGNGTAKDLAVYARFPTGEAYILKGPRKLTARQRATYILQGKPTVLSTGYPSVSTQCSTCRG